MKIKIIRIDEFDIEMENEAEEQVIWALANSNKRAKVDYPTYKDNDLEQPTHTTLKFRYPPKPRVKK